VKKSFIAGLLSVIGGGLGIMSVFSSGIWFLFGGLGPMFPSRSDWGTNLLPWIWPWGTSLPSWFWPMVVAIVVITAVVYLAGAVVAIIGGLSAMRQKSWLLGLAGAIGAFFAYPALGIAAIVLMALGRNEFPGPIAGPPAPPPA